MTASPVHDPLVERLRRALSWSSKVSDEALDGEGVRDRFVADMEAAETALTALQARLAVPEGTTGELVNDLRDAANETRSCYGMKVSASQLARADLLDKAASTITAQEREIVALRPMEKLLRHIIADATGGTPFLLLDRRNAAEAFLAALDATRLHGEGGA